MRLRSIRNIHGHSIRQAMSMASRQFTGNIQVTSNTTTTTITSICTSFHSVCMCSGASISNINYNPIWVHYIISHIFFVTVPFSSFYQHTGKTNAKEEEEKKRRETTWYAWHKRTSIEQYRFICSLTVGSSFVCTFASLQFQLESNDDDNVCNNSQQTMRTTCCCNDNRDVCSGVKKRHSRLHFDQQTLTNSQIWYDSLIYFHPSIHRSILPSILCSFLSFITLIGMTHQIGSTIKINNKNYFIRSICNFIFSHDFVSFSYNLMSFCDSVFILKFNLHANS